MTGDAKRENMAQRIERAKKQVKDKGREAIAGLEKVTIDLRMESLSKQLRNVHADFTADTFKLMVVGRFKTGKSSLINAILGKPAGTNSQAGPMPVDDLPATAILTSIDYAETPSVNAWDFKGKKHPWTLERYHREAVLRSSEKENRDFFENIRQFEVGFPAEVLRCGVTVMDSPGTDEHPNRTAITADAVRRCDAVIVMYRHDSFAGETERAWVAENILDSGVRVFTVVNLWNGREVDDRLRQLAWDKLVRELLEGEEYKGQDFATRDIYFADAERACEARYTDNQSLLIDSGVTQLEGRLTDFLLNERYETHVGRFVKAAENHADDMRRDISQRRAALTADRDKLLTAANSIQPKLDAIARRRDKLTTLLDRYRRECARELTIGFERMIGQLRLDLYDACVAECKKSGLKSLAGVVGLVKAHFSQKKVLEEASTICTDIITQRITSWCKNPANKPGANQLCEPILRRMVDELVDEFTTIRTDFKDIHLQLTGWEPELVSDSKVDMVQRIATIVLGALLQDAGVALSGSWRGLAGTLGGYVAAGLLVAIFHLSAPVALPLVLLLGLVGGIGWARHGLEERLFKKICDSADEQLRSYPAKATPAIEEASGTAFEAIESAVLKDVDAIIAQEKQNIQEVLDLNQQGQNEKTKSLKALEMGEAAIEKQCKELKNVLLLAKQAK